jgi:hypothetical protein
VMSTGYSRAAEAAQGEFTILRKPYQIATLGRMVGSFIATARRQPQAPNLVHLRDRKSRDEKPG